MLARKPQPTTLPVTHSHPRQASYRGPGAARRPASLLPGVRGLAVLGAVVMTLMAAYAFYAPLVNPAMVPTDLRRHHLQPQAHSDDGPSSRGHVLGLADGMKAGSLYHFANSLRKHSPGARLVLFMRHESVTAEVLSMMEGLGVDEVVSFYKPQFAYIVEFRFVAFRDYIGRYIAEGDTVVISDTRDVFFQGDLFAAFEAELRGRKTPVGGSRVGSILVSVEGAEPPKTIRTCPYNSKWIDACWGEEGMNILGDRAILCAGLTIGHRTAMLLYTSRVAELMSGGSLKCTFTRGIDQGAHNYFFHLEADADGIDVLMTNNLESSIFTPGYTPADLWDVSVQGVVAVNGRETQPPAAVHQMDRFPERLARVRALTGY